MTTRQPLDFEPLDAAIARLTTIATEMREANTALRARVDERTESLHQSPEATAAKEQAVRTTIAAARGERGPMRALILAAHASVLAAGDPTLEVAALEILAETLEALIPAMAADGDVNAATRALHEALGLGGVDP